MARHSETRVAWGEAKSTGSTSKGLGTIRPASGARWEGFTHRQMWDMIMRANPNELFGRVDQWRGIANRLVEHNTTIQRRLNALLATWRGPAAGSAAQSQQRLLDWAQDAAERASTVSTQLGNYGNALVNARMKMPQPQHRWAEQNFRDGEGANALDGVAGAHLLLQMQSDRLPTAQEARQARQDAIEVMREFDNQASTSERAMPRFEAAPHASAPPSQDPPKRPVIPPEGHRPERIPAPNPGQPLPDRQSPAADPMTTTQASAYGPPGGLGGADVAYGRGATGGPAAGGDTMHGGRGGPAGPLAAGGGSAAGAGMGGAAVLGTGPARGRMVPGAGFAGGVVPPGGGARQEEDVEKPLADYIKGDDLFYDERPVSKPVWGE